MTTARRVLGAACAVLVVWIAAAGSWELVTHDRGPVDLGSPVSLDPPPPGGTAIPGTGTAPSAPDTSGQTDDGARAVSPGPPAAGPALAPPTPPPAGNPTGPTPDPGAPVEPPPAALPSAPPPADDTTGPSPAPDPVPRPTSTPTPQPPASTPTGPPVPLRPTMVAAPDHGLPDAPPRPAALPTEPPPTLWFSRWIPSLDPDDDAEEPDVTTDDEPDTEGAETVEDLHDRPSGDDTSSGTGTGGTTR